LSSISISSTNADRVEEDRHPDCRAANGTTTAIGRTTRVAGWAAHGFVRLPPPLSPPAAETALAPPRQASLSAAAPGIGKVDGSSRREEQRRM
jgi:hypothetical protein